MDTHAAELNGKIEARLVPQSERPQALPRHFARHMVTVEHHVFSFMHSLAPDYRGGYWHFYELSNGGFYMAPWSERFLMRVAGNGYEGSMSADAAGITACLFALSYLSFQVSDESISRHFYLLRDFALEHAEIGEIFAAID